MGKDGEPEVTETRTDGRDDTKRRTEPRHMNTAE